MYQKKKEIVEQEVNRIFFHFHIYQFVKYMFNHYGFTIKLIWFVFVAIALIGKVLDIDHPAYTWTVAGWFFTWIGTLFLSGIDRIFIDIKLMRIYRLSADRCNKELEEYLSEIEYRSMLRDILGE